MRLVVDTSVAIKWVSPEVGHQVALDLLDSDAEFLAPDLLFAEFANVLRKKIKAGEASIEQAEAACRQLPGFLSSVIPALLLFERALQISVEINHPVYDCVFLACAEQNGVRLVTADEKMMQRVESRGLSHLVISLDDTLRLAEDRPQTAISDSQAVAMMALHDRLSRTFAFIQEQAVPPSTAFRFVPSEVYASAFESPVYVRLMRAIGTLSRDQMRDLVALCWLGRGHEGTDWPGLQARAETMLGASSTDHRPYIISLLSDLRSGLHRLKDDIQLHSKNREL
ncbi:PIN domain-containing protein [Methylobacterium sp. EM32]|uniref:PIN domain-containing protein n=1 Tax=Methylobacterium sp. EM32 TaxID=3163481 RepID=UPI0033A48F8D